MGWTKIILRTALVSALAGGFMFFGSTTNALADDRDNCYHNVHNWERKLDRDTDRHGVDSRQARHDRHELDEARESCQRRFGNNWQDHRDYDRDYDRP